MTTAIDFGSQVAVVTGAGRGLGRRYAMDLAERGATVVVNDIGAAEDGRPRAQVVADEIVGNGGTAEASQDDVTTAEGCANVVAAATEGHGRIDVLVHNAGFLRPSHIADMTDEQLTSVVNVHLMAGIALSRAAWPHMQAQSYGRIVMTSSGAIFGHMGQANYVAAKAGVLGLVRALALEGAEFDLRANAILPYAQSQIAQDNPLVGADESRIRPMLVAMNARRTPGAVSPMTLYLASRACEPNGEAFSALAGRYARVLLGLTDGWIAGDGPASVEDIADHIGEITDPAGYELPRSMEDEVEGVLHRLEERGLLAQTD